MSKVTVYMYVDIHEGIQVINRKSACFEAVMTSFFT